MYVVLDTNIVISGLLWSGKPRQLISVAQNETIELFTSQFLLDELLDVLIRPKFSERIERFNTTPANLVAHFQALTTVVEPEPFPPTIEDDPDDDHVLACAVTAKAIAIVSGDNHLLDLNIFNDIRILTADQFIIDYL